MNTDGFKFIHLYRYSFHPSLNVVLRITSDNWTNRNDW